MMGILSLPWDTITTWESQPAVVSTCRAAPIVVSDTKSNRNPTSEAASIHYRHSNVFTLSPVPPLRATEIARARSVLGAITRSPIGA
jgi:hypothetical protein